jgi:hypothetical protein
MHQSLDDELIHAQDKHTGNFVVMIHAYVGSSLARRTRASTVSCPSKSQVLVYKSYQILILRGHVVRASPISSSIFRSYNLI